MMNLQQIFIVIIIITYILLLFFLLFFIIILLVGYIMKFLMLDMFILEDLSIDKNAVTEFE